MRRGAEVVCGQVMAARRDAAAGRLACRGDVGAVKVR